MTLQTGGRAQSFPPEPVSAGQARRFLRTFLAEGGRDDLADVAVLALSEVVTNALLHAHTDFTVRALLLDDGAVLVEVQDQSPALPIARTYAEHATTGRGMRLVAALTADCGVEVQDAVGKTVWFVVRDGDGDGDGERDRAPWSVRAAAAGLPDGGTTVLLQGMPSGLWLAAREHHDAILRELSLYAQEHPGEVPATQRLAQADQARARVSTAVVFELERAAPAATGVRPAAGAPVRLEDIARSLPALDLRMPVPADGGEACAALQDVLDTAERLAVAGRLLAQPGLPEIVSVRDWVCEQVIAQLAGVPAAPWPGTADERFTVAVNDRVDQPPPVWDASAVTSSGRAAVAVDEANRIIAVSRPAADALGWAVDDLTGRRVVTLIPPEFREAHVAGFSRHLTTGEQRVLGLPLRLPVLRADGAHVECDVLIERASAEGSRRVWVAWLDPR